MQTNALFVYARTSSTRLPGKALKPIAELSLIETVIDGLRALEKEYKIVLLTSNETSDDVLETIAMQNNISCSRGSLNDVAQRTIDAIKTYQIDYFARINGDCPIQKTDLLKEGFTKMGEGGFDLVSNIFPRTFPYGISVEIIKAEVFVKNYESFNAYEKENITSYFYTNSERFKINSLISPTNFFEQGVELTVDDENSYRIMKKLFEVSPDIRQKPIAEILKLYKTINRYD
jgi:spore coat polysaccharide biosynthesis protein SpsF